MIEIYDYRKTDGVFFVDFDEVENFPIAENTLIRYIEDTDMNIFHSADIDGPVTMTLHAETYLSENELEVIKDYLDYLDNVQ